MASPAAAGAAGAGFGERHGMGGAAAGSAPASSADQALLESNTSSAAAVPSPRPGLYKRFKATAKRLKREVLALYYALQDPRTGVLPRLIGVFVLAYALSPFDLIPDFIPVLGLLDDLLLLPGMIWLAVKLIPAPVMADSRARAEREPLRLSKNWGAACAVLLLWDALLLWLLCLALATWAPAVWGQQRLRWAVLGGTAAALVAGEAAWCVWQARRERRMAALVAAKDEAAADLEEGLLSRSEEGAGGQQ